MEFNMKKIKMGMIVEGKVFMVTDKSVHVDLGAHAEGVIYKDWLTLEDIVSCKDVVKEGETIKAKITKIDDENQQILLSCTDILLEEKRKDFDTYSDQVDSFKAKVKKAVRGGLILDFNGIEMFMHVSEIDINHVENVDAFVGQTLEVTVIENKDGKIRVSRRKILEKQRKLDRKNEFDQIKENDIVTGTVANIMDFGAFVDLGHNQGLIHKSQISHYRTDHIEDVLKVGDKVEAKVISKEKGKIGLSIKALQKTPWEIFGETHKVGDEIKGKIVRKMAIGMLVEVEKDVVGMIHKKDYSWDPRQNLAGEVEVGHELTLKILSLDVKNRKMGLSKKHLEYNPWKDVTVKVGEEVSGTVEELQSNGALVKIQGVKAFLPIGEIKQDRVQEISQVLKVDDVINAVVTNVDKQMWKMTISIKQLVEGKQRAEFEEYLKTEEQVANTTLGDLFKDQLEKFKK